MPTNLSAYEFARGDRTGVLTTQVPEKTSSNAAVNLLSLSRIKNRKLACAVPKLAHGRWPGVSRSLGRSAVLADQAAEDLPALDPGGDVNGVARLA